MSQARRERGRLDTQSTRTERVALLIRGKVQGVFFRESTRREAQRLGLTGWVRNLDSGEVEAVAEGPGAALDEFMRWCHNGPPAARVDEVRATRAPATSEFSQFEVRR